MPKATAENNADGKRIGDFSPVLRYTAAHAPGDTSGFIAADTHLHTLTFSGHDNAMVEDRLLTSASEGVE